MRGKVFIGTSGWHYKHWRGNFYPPELTPQHWLEYYSTKFKTVELNNSFYHLPSHSSFESWRRTSPRGFVFAVKGSRYTTHMKKLKDPKVATKKFFDGAERLGKKLGPVLFQLPPRWNVDLQRLDEFLTAMPKTHRYAFEFRDDSWLTAEVYELLERHNAALCIHDLGGRQSPIEITANFTYVRFHGPTAAKYSGSYSRAALKTWTTRIEKWRKELKEIYAYFNNDVGGCAPRNAEELKQRLGE
jgi:uncharacterized protein YecE (DUF72 family)